MTAATQMPARSRTLPRAANFTDHVRAFARRLACMSVLHRQRCALAALDDRLLADVGVTRAQALAELEAPLWDGPRHWRG
jgi:uncharacterized protein YjiS (DUF1127 family)